MEEESRREGGQERLPRAKCKEGDKAGERYFDDDDIRKQIARERALPGNGIGDDDNDNRRRRTGGASWE